MYIIPAAPPKSLTGETAFYNYLLIVDVYSKIPNFYGMERFSTEEVMDKLDMFQGRFGKIDKFILWDLDRVSVDTGTQFTSTEFHDECQTRGVWITLASPEHHKMDGNVKGTQRTLCTITHSLIVHTIFLGTYIHFMLIYTEDHIFQVLSIKELINKAGELATPFKLATGTKPSTSHLNLLFCPCVVQKATAHVGKKALNMRHQAQNYFSDISVGIPQHQKGYLVYVPHKLKIVSSRNFFK